jgi:hypothetical protein
MNDQLRHHWPTVRRLFAEALRTSYHFSLATTDAAGNPHITPIGSLYLEQEPRGYYFDIFSKNMNQNLENQNRVCVMAVPSRLGTWLRALVTGRFAKPPGIRLYGRVGPRREATAVETARWRKNVRAVSFLKGHDLLWGDLKHVREIVFDDWAPIQLGVMTRGLWQKKRS